MLKHRAIRLSIKDRIRDMFLSPDAATGLSPYNVYYESQFRDVPRGLFTPTYPFVYLLDSYLLPVHQQIDLMQPQVVTEISQYMARPFELGNRSGRWVKACVYVLGQNRGQRDDIGSFIMDYFGTTLDVKDYSAGVPTGTVVETAIIDDDRSVTDLYTPGLEIELAGGLLMGLTKVEFSLRPKI